MKTYLKVNKNGQYISGVECFSVAKDDKSTKQRVAFVDNKSTNFVFTGTCKCGGRIVEVMKSPINWQTCEKCGADKSEYSFPRRLVGHDGDLPKYIP